MTDLTYPMPGFPKVEKNSTEDWVPIDGQWHSLVYVHHPHGVATDLYVDGKLIPASGEMEPVNGIRNWNRALSREQVEHRYADAIRALYPAYYSGDDPAFGSPAADSLDAAWAEAEVALPEGWHIRSLESTDWDNSGWDVVAGSADFWAGPADHESVHAFGEGLIPTPAAALRALAAKLREVAR